MFLNDFFMSPKRNEKGDAENTNKKQQLPSSWETLILEKFSF